MVHGQKDREGVQDDMSPTTQKISRLIPKDLESKNFQ